MSGILVVLEPFCKNSSGRSCEESQTCLFPLWRNGCFPRRPEPVVRKTHIWNAWFQLFCMAVKIGSWQKICYWLWRVFKKLEGGSSNSRFHSALAVCVLLKWPSVQTRVLMRKLIFLKRVVSGDEVVSSCVQNTGGRRCKSLDLSHMWWTIIYVLFVIFLYLGYVWV